MHRPRTPFPVSEGIGIFVGVVAWDLLMEGQLGVIKALLIAAPCAVAWFGIRCWRERPDDQHREPPPAAR